MGLLVDWQIRELCKGGSPLISPFSENTSGEGIISYGLDHAGYCLRLAPEILVFKNSYGEPVDPKRFKDKEYTSRMFDRVIGGWHQAVTIPPNGYILGMSYEYIRIPRNLKGRCVGKSTLARSGIIANMTPLEPEWEGHLTIEISNASPCQALVYVMEGIVQLEFDELAANCERSYKDKNGIYQNQTGVTVARVR